MHVGRLERDIDVSAKGVGRGLDRLGVTEVVREPQLVFGNEGVAQDLDVCLGRWIVRVAEGEVEDPGFMATLLVPRESVEVVEQLERRRGGDGGDAI
jgi:hypothetical protein